MERMQGMQVVGAAYARIGVDPVHRLTRLGTPLAGSLFIACVILAFLFPTILGGAVGVLNAFAIPLLALLIVMGWPILKFRQSAALIEQDMHMFVTRMGILALGEVGPKSMFDMLRQMSEYGELAVEVKRIETMVQRWHTSLPEAARIVANQTPSPLFADFLDRMAFSIESGQSLEEYMSGELVTVRQEYQTLYDTRLETLDILKELYISLSTAMIFLLVVSGIHLVLFITGTPNSGLDAVAQLRWVLFSGAMFFFVQVASAVIFRTVIPAEPLFAKDGLVTPYRQRFSRIWNISITIGIMVGGFVILFAILAPSFVADSFARWGLVMAALPFTPFLFASRYEKSEEERIRRRDESYPVFIRALGGTAQARSSEPSATMKALRGIDFGILSADIERLERRLATRIDSDRAWDYFSAEVNSSMSSRFNRIYIEGAQTSGLPADVADIVSQTTTNLNSLRKRRMISAGSMWGVALGTLIATIASLDITLHIVVTLGQSMAGIITDPTSVEGGRDLLGDLAGFGIPVLSDSTAVKGNTLSFQIIISFLILSQIASMSFVTTRLRGGKVAGTLGQMAILTWTAAITRLIVDLVMSFAVGSFIGAGG